MPAMQSAARIDSSIFARALIVFSFSLLGFGGSAYVYRYSRAVNASMVGSLCFSALDFGSRPDPGREPPRRFGILWFWIAGKRGYGRWVESK